MFETGPLFEKRMESENEMKKKKTAELAGTATTANQSVPQAEPDMELENPRHKEDFSRLLKATTRKRGPKD